MKSAYKVDYQGLNPEIIEGLRDCTINAIDDSLIFDDHEINQDFMKYRYDCDSVDFAIKYSDD